jgi:sphingolipid delta-4 desaturase
MRHTNHNQAIGTGAARLVREHPELLGLSGPHLPTLGWIGATIAIQLLLAGLVADLPWWGIFLAAYTVGATASLALWVLLHESTHDLVFNAVLANRWLGIVTGLPLVVPAASGFRTCHLLHHRHFGDPVWDGEIASPWEARAVGHCPVRKALWLLLQPLMQLLRPLRIPGLNLIDRWFVANLVVQAAFNMAVIMVLGWGAFAYLLLANLFALGLHPFGARWIQEHFLRDPDQLTYSYYGPANVLAFNAGFHSEHHDFPRVAWAHLPRLHRMLAPRYDSLHAYRSWSRLLVQFLLDRELTLANRRFSTGVQADQP